MNQSDQHLEDIKVIKRIMEESSRFLSLSGLSGIIAGLAAIAGAIVAKLVIDNHSPVADWFARPFAGDPESRRMIILLFADMAVVLIVALAAAVILSTRMARKRGIKAWTPVTRRMLASLIVPLVTGGLFIILTITSIPASVSVASTMIFYGLAVISAGKFTFGEIHWLGVLEVSAGLICLIMPSWSVLIWAAGFGLIHIGYGLFMHLRYRG